MGRKRKQDVVTDDPQIDTLSLSGFAPAISQRVIEHYSIDQIPYRSKKILQGHQSYRLMSKSEPINNNIKLAEQFQIAHHFVIPAINSRPFQERKRKCEKFMDFTTSCPAGFLSRRPLTKTQLYTATTLPRFRKPRSNAFQNSINVKSLRQELKEATHPKVKAKVGNSVESKSDKNGSINLTEIPSMIPSDVKDRHHFSDHEHCESFNDEAPDSRSTILCSPNEQSSFMDEKVQIENERLKNTSDEFLETDVPIKVLKLPEILEEHLPNKKPVLPSLSYLSDLVSKSRLAAFQAAGDSFASYYKYHGGNKRIIDDSEYESYSRTCKMPTAQRNG